MVVYLMYQAGHSLGWLLVLAACIVAITRRRTVGAALQLAGVCLVLLAGVANSAIMAWRFRLGLGSVPTSLLEVAMTACGIVGVGSLMLFAVGCLIEALRSRRQGPWA